MVICVLVGCSKHSDRDKDVTFHRIPAVLKHLNERDLDLSKRRRDGYIAAISREDIDHTALESIEFVRGTLFQKNQLSCTTLPTQTGCLPSTLDIRN